MSEMLKNLFDENESVETTSSRALAGTAQLTSLSAALANEALKKVDADLDKYQTALTESIKDHNAMDFLIALTLDLSNSDISFLTALSDETLDSMLKSQQSKRSRSKGRTMTMDNYRSMMTAAIAENLLRLALGKTKSVTSGRRNSGSVSFTDEQLAELAADQEKLRKEIRNVQSKKSIMKSKEGFSEDDDRWQQLLVAEEQLKGLRTETTKVVQIDDTKNKLLELLNGKDLSNLKGAEAKKLLEEIGLTVLSVAEEPTAE